MSESCPKCGSQKLHPDDRYFICGADSHGQYSGPENCWEAQLAAATKRAGCRDLIARLRTRIAEAEQERDEAESRVHFCPTCKMYCKECECVEAKIFAAEQENATRVKEYREKVEQLETDKAFYHDKWLNALERLKAAEHEDARLREGIEATINYVRTGVHCRMIDHKMDSCDCEKICDEFAALLAQPKGGPDA